MNTERRHAHRQYLRVTAVLTLEGAQPMTVHTVNVGLAGMALNGPHKMPTDEAVALSFNIPVHGKLEQIEVSGHISYCAPEAPGFKIGVRFAGLDGQSRKVIDAYLLSE